MRTTLTLNDDVATAIERMPRTREASFKDIVNEALRRGLKEMAAGPKPRDPFRTQPVSLGRALVSIDNVSEALAIAEGESFK